MSYDLSRASLGWRFGLIYEERTVMDQESHRSLTGRLLGAVLAAAKLEMGYFKSGLAVDTKSDRSPVTAADREAEALILAALRRELPGIAIVAEEEFAAGERPRLTNPFLLVDALDGTKQFISGHREFTINIALVEGGRPVYGLVYAPALDDFLVTDGPGRAVRARFAPDAAITSLDAAGPAEIRTRAPPAAGIVALQSRSRNADASNAFLAAFPVATKRQLGSSYKFCLIAAGEADVYTQFGDTREWDTAAGHAILEAAGGTVSAAGGGALVYAKSGLDYLNPQFIASSRPLGALKAHPPIAP